MKICERLNRLPNEVQDEVKAKLKGWTGVYVERNEQTGEWHVSTMIGITKEYNPWKVIEAFDARDIYTPEEIRKYADEFWAGVEMF